MLSKKLILLALLVLTGSAYAGQFRITYFTSPCGCNENFMIDSLYQVKSGIELNWTHASVSGGTKVNSWLYDTVEIGAPSIFLSSIKHRAFPEDAPLPDYHSSYNENAQLLFKKNSVGKWYYESYPESGSEYETFNFDASGGWANSLVFGFIWGKLYPWIYADEYGWLYIEEATPQPAGQYRETYNVSRAGLNYWVWNATFNEWVWLFYPLEVNLEPSPARLWSFKAKDWFSPDEYWGLE